jgi:hypothetical protein
MGFDKDYPNRKDRRKAYKGAKAVDKQCRNNGRCSYCSGNRTYANRKREDGKELKG